MRGILVKFFIRLALEDISNKSLPVKNHVKESCQNTGVAIRNLFGSRQAASVASRSTIGISYSTGRVGFQGKKSVVAGSLHEQFASWGSGQPVQKEKGLYIFGQQPPNIGEMATSRDDNSGSDSDDEVLILSDSEGLDPTEKMDFSEGHISSHGGHLARATSSKFKSNVLDLIRTHRLDMLFLCEPRISGAKATSVVKSLGFPCFEIVDVVGFSGGLWLLWDYSRVHVEVVGTSDQTISACVARNGQDPWLFTGVYASPNVVKRVKMWDYLSFVAASHNMPWLIAGDFNGLLTADEKFGGALECKSKGFRNWVDGNEMIDLGYSGPKFTWNNKRVYASICLGLLLITIQSRLRSGMPVCWLVLMLFSQEIVKHSYLTLPKLFPVIDAANLELLEKEVDMAEIKQSLFGIGGLKALGVYGFPACFYQAQWNKCADDIFAMVTQAFQKCSIPDKLNYTLITLVPKLQSPQSMVQFRPISLCSTLYKVISKILVARLRPILPNLISPNQELMHKFKLSKGKKGFVAWKIDLSKAYDRLSWHFVEYVLLELRLPAPLVKLIMNCVQSVRYQINVNGELTAPFSPMNGIRQGDPLSPYLFVLCIKKLSHVIYDAVSKNKWRPVKSSQSGPAISHLFFADDLVLFAEASASQAKIMKSCLDLFCSASGQVVNFDKSAIFYSPNTCKEVAKETSLICGSPLTNDLGKGGLGFKKTASMNQALLAKIGWRLHSKDNGLWAKIYEAKYLKGASIFDNSLGARQVCTTTWRSIMHGIQLLMQGMRWRIGRGDSVKF
ncbi:unnamed protein product [Prunus armeniaca]